MALKKKDSTRSEPIVNDSEFHFVQKIVIADDLEIECFKRQLDFLISDIFDFNKITVFEAENNIQIKYAETIIISIEEQDERIKQFVEANLDKIVFVEVGKNNNPINNLDK